MVDIIALGQEGGKACIILFLVLGVVELPDDLSVVATVGVSIAFDEVVAQPDKVAAASAAIRAVAKCFLFFNMKFSNVRWG